MAVVYHHIIRHNYYGARKVIRRAISNLTPFIDIYFFDIPGILSGLESIDSRLLQFGLNKAEVTNPELLLPVKLRQ